MGQAGAVGGTGGSGRFWLCPQCGRHVPMRIEACRCGSPRPESTPPAAPFRPPVPGMTATPGGSAPARAGGSAGAGLVYPNEPPLFLISLVLSVGFWLLLLVGTLGLALIYALMFFVVYLFAQSGLIAYIKGNAVRITPQQFPDLHQRLEACCQRIGMAAVPETYLLHGDGAFNAFATRFLGRSFLILYSDMVDALETRPAALNFYLGHELGHVHRGHLVWRPALLPASFLPLLGAAYHRACESTCDIHGASCCDDLEDAVRGLSALGAGGRRWQDLNVAEYLRQSGDTSGFWMSFHELLSDYPWLVKRVARLAARADGAAPSLPARHPVAYFFALFVPRTMAGAGAASVLMMVAVIGIIAAIAIPSLLRARVSANESAALGDVRTMVSAQAAYESATGSYALPECLAAPSQPGCFEGYPPDRPAFIDAALAGATLKGGYNRTFSRGADKPTAANPNGIATYCYSAVPAAAGQTGVRSFAADHSGRVCHDPNGSDLCLMGSLRYGCTPIP